MAFPLHDTPQRSVWSVMLLGQETRNRSPLTCLQTVTRRGEHTPESQACFCGGQRRSWLYHITLPYYLIPLRQEFKISPPPARLTTSKTQTSPVFPAAPPPPPVLGLQGHTLPCRTFHMGARDPNSGPNVCIANALIH